MEELVSVTVDHRGAEQNREVAEQTSALHAQGVAGGDAHEAHRAASAAIAEPRKAVSDNLPEEGRRLYQAIHEPVRLWPARLAHGLGGVLQPGPDQASSQELGTGEEGGPRLRGEEGPPCGAIGCGDDGARGEHEGLVAGRSVGGAAKGVARGEDGLLLAQRLLDEDLVVPVEGGGGSGDNAVRAAVNMDRALEHYVEDCLGLVELVLQVDDAVLRGRGLDSETSGEGHHVEVPPQVHEERKLREVRSERRRFGYLAPRGAVDSTAPYDGRDSTLHCWQETRECNISPTQRQDCCIV